MDMFLPECSITDSFISYLKEDITHLLLPKMFSSSYPVWERFLFRSEILDVWVRRIIFTSCWWKVWEEIDEPEYLNLHYRFLIGIYPRQILWNNPRFLYWIETWLPVRGLGKVKHLITHKLSGRRFITNNQKDVKLGTSQTLRNTLFPLWLTAIPRNRVP